MKGRIVDVAFANKKLEEAYEKLKRGKFEDRALYSKIDQALEQLRSEPLSGQQIRKNRIPRDFKKHAVTNLWKLNLSSRWRLIYTIIGNEVRIISMVLDWLTHKEYDRTFKYT